MSIGLIGRKVGMTQVFQDDGTMVAVSVLAIEPNTVTRLRTSDRDGYTAVQLGTDDGQRRRLTKPVLGQLKDLPKEAGKPGTLREFRVESVDDFSLGQTLSVGDVFAAGDLVDVTGVSKGKGFAGQIKRHNFRRGPKTHGSDHHREPGSIGPGTTPGRVYKGLRMAGHMGHQQVTTLNLEVVESDPERNLLLLKGSVPGPNGGVVLVRKAVKSEKS
jgi:large subunit ribosomal protein L3